MYIKSNKKTESFKSVDVNFVRKLVMHVVNKPPCNVYALENGAVIQRPGFDSRLRQTDFFGGFFAL